MSYIAGHRGWFGAPGRGPSVADGVTDSRQVVCHQSRQCSLVCGVARRGNAPLASLRSSGGKRVLKLLSSSRYCSWLNTWTHIVCLQPEGHAMRYDTIRYEMLF